MADGLNDPFEPVIQPLAPNPEMAARRVEGDAAARPMNARWALVATPRLQACQDAVDQLANYHAQLVDNLDIDLEGETRWTAILLSTGRCISLADALIDQLRRGYASEMAGTARMLHEGLELALALAAGAEQPARDWLAGKPYNGKLARRERKEYFARLVTDAEAQALLEEAVAEHIAAAESEMGVEITDAADAIHVVSGRHYGELSASAHNVRRGFADAIAVPVRRFTYGRQPDPRVRSSWIEIGEIMIEQACLDVPAALAEIVGVDHVRETTLRLVTHLQAVRDQYPFS